MRCASIPMVHQSLLPPALVASLLSQSVVAGPLASLPKHRILERLTPRESTPLSWVIGDLGRLCLDIRSSYILKLLSIFDICCYTKVVTDMSRVHHVMCPLSFPGAAEVAPHYGEWTPATPSARFCVCRKSVRGNSEPLPDRF